MFVALLRRSGCSSLYSVGVDVRSFTPQEWMFVALLRRGGMFIALFRSPTLRSFGVRCVLIRESYKHPAPSERDVFSYPRAINILLLRSAMCSHTRSYKHPAPSERDVFSYPEL